MTRTIKTTQPVVMTAALLANQALFTSGKGPVVSIPDTFVGARRPKTGTIPMSF